jgi:DNA-binding NtrC family response regulator
MQYVAILEDLYLFYTLQSDLFMRDGVKHDIFHKKDDLLSAIHDKKYDLIMIDRYYEKDDYDALEGKLGQKIKKLGFRNPLLLWTNNVVSKEDLKEAGFDFHIEKTVYRPADLKKIIGEKCV